jgi:hypothetical protein
VVTSVFGGVLRDVLVNEVPRALSDHRPYALWAFAGGWLYVGLLHAQAPGPVALLACLAVTAGLRGLALWRNWQSDPLEDQRNALPHANAHGAQRVPAAGGVQAVHRRGGQPRARWRPAGGPAQWRRPRR